MNREAKSATFDDGLLNLINRSVKVGDVVMTLGRARPNRIAWINGDGVWVSTEKSDREGTGPQLVPAWMIAAAWNRLVQRGRLSQQELLEQLNVKRSAFVCALLARFPDVDAETGPQSLAQPVALILSAKVHREEKLTSAPRVKFHWEHNSKTHEDYTLDCPWGVYYKLQAIPDDDGNCSGGKDNWYGRTCGQPWGDQRRSQYWCRIVYSDGREQWVHNGTSSARPYNAFLAHKESVLSGTGSAESGSQPVPSGEETGEHDFRFSEFHSNSSKPVYAESREPPERAGEAPRKVPADLRARDGSGSAIRLPEGSPFNDELFERIRLAVDAGDEIATLSTLELNEIVSIDRDGIDVSTEHSKRLGTEPQRVPAWMLMRAWEYLSSNGSLSQQGLLEDLEVKSSAFVCALLATFPDVDVDSLRPTVLRWTPV
jgi:hypothetical protein